MENKVQRIISEVEKRWKELAEKNVKAGGNKYDGEIYQLLSILNFINDLEKEGQEKEEQPSHKWWKEDETQKRYDRWWKIMNIPMGEIPQEDLEWAAVQDEFNSYQSKKNFEWELERRANSKPNW